MHVLIDLVVAVLAGGVAVTGSVALVMRRRLHRSNRLAPGVATVAPLRWRWSLRRPAVLHRRLQRSCQIVLAATGGPSAYRRSRFRRRGRERGEGSMLQATGRALLDHAAALDLRLVSVDRGGPAWRRLHLPGLATEIRAVEASAVRLAQLSQAFADELEASTGPSRTEQPEVLLDAMEATIADLRRLAPAAAPRTERTGVTDGGRIRR